MALLSWLRQRPQKVCCIRFAAGATGRAGSNGATEVSDADNADADIDLSADPGPPADLALPPAIDSTEDDAPAALDTDGVVSTYGADF